MKLKIIFFFLLTISTVKNGLSQNYFVVKSIIKLPSDSCFLIKLKNSLDSTESKEIWIISDTKNKIKSNNTTIIQIGSKVLVCSIHEIPKESNPFYKFLNSKRQMEGLYFGDEIVYDSEIKQYSSKCFQGLYYNLDCKCKKRLYKRGKLFLKKKRKWLSPFDSCSATNQTYKAK